MNEWIPCKDWLPCEDVEVETKIDDLNGCRKEQPLIRHSNLWFYPDMSMYVYYTPTHWRSIGG